MQWKELKLGGGRREAERRREAGVGTVERIDTGGWEKVSGETVGVGEGGQWKTMTLERGEVG